MELWNKADPRMSKQLGGVWWKGMLCFSGLLVPRKRRSGIFQLLLIAGLLGLCCNRALCLQLLWISANPASQQLKFSFSACLPVAAQLRLQRILQELQLDGPCAIVTMSFPVPGLELQLSFKLTVSREHCSREMLVFFPRSKTKIS